MNEVKNKKDVLVVSKIDNGIVIDHIPAGFSMYLIRLLDINPQYSKTVSFAINVASKKQGKKDILKIKDVTIDEIDLDKLGLIVSGATINIIKDYKVIEKKQVNPPKIVKGTMRCPNNKCITNAREDIENEFEVIEDGKTIKIRCIFCDKIFDVIENIEYLI